ncbi:unnamed protein product, partial [Rotaria socialis]
MMVMIILLYSLFYSCQLIDGTTKSDLWWNIGLERRNDNILSSYSFANSDHQYAVEDDPSSYCQS